MRAFVFVLAAILLLNLALTAVALRRATKAESVAIRAAASKATLRTDTARDLAAFERNPSAQTLIPIQDDIIGEPAQLPIVVRLAKVVADRDLPDPVENAIVVDLTRYDVTDTIRWLHQFNVVARLNPTADGPAIVKRTAKACWLVLGLRPNYGTAGIDLTRMDLRTNAAFVGQQMNLSYVDFRDAILPGGTWRGSNLSNSAFDNVQVDGALSCLNCLFGERRVDGVTTLREGRWTSSTPGKPPTRVD